MTTEGSRPSAKAGASTSANGLVEVSDHDWRCPRCGSRDSLQIDQDHDLVVVAVSLPDDLFPSGIGVECEGCGWYGTADELAAAAHLRKS